MLRTYSVLTFGLSILLASAVTSYSFAGEAAPENAPVKLFVELNPVGSFVAHTKSLSGVAKQVGETFEAEGIEIDLRTLKTGIDLRDKHMTEKYFETKVFPKATLKKATGRDGNFEGQLTIHGVTHEVSGEYAVVSGRIHAKFTVKISDFNIKKANYMGVGVEDEVQVEVRVPIKK